MHPTKQFHNVSPTDNLNFACHRGFGNLVASGKNKEHLISSAPFYLTNTDYTSVNEAVIRAHLAIANPLYKELETHGSVQCTIVVSGPDGYISPDWYGLDDQVPTWNYITVQLKGTLKLLPREDLREVLTELSTKFEEKLVGTKPSVWKLGKVKAANMNAMMKVIGPISFEVESVDGTWKLGQNKPQTARNSVGDSISLLNNHTVKTRQHLCLGIDLPVLANLHSEEVNSDNVVEILLKGNSETKSIPGDVSHSKVVILLGVIIHMYMDKYMS